MWVAQSRESLAAEADQTRRASVIHADVGKGELAMHHQMAVCKGHGLQHMGEEGNPGARAERVVGTVLVQCDAFSKLYCQPRCGRVQRCVNQCGNARMMQRSQGALGRSQPLDQHIGRKRRVGTRDPDGDRLRKVTDTLGAIKIEALVLSDPFKQPEFAGDGSRVLCRASPVVIATGIHKSSS